MEREIAYSFSLLLTLGNNHLLPPELRVSEKKPPNIIIIMADDMGWGDTGYHGSRIKTPNIDRLSGEGIILSRFYVAPVSTPTRAGLLTGMYPGRFGLREDVIPPWRDFGLDPASTLIPDFLAEHGYRNRAIIGKWHLGHSRPEYYPLKNGFTHFYGHLNGAIDYFTHFRDGELDWHDDYNSNYDKGYSTDLLADESVKCIRKYSKDGPFFLYVAFNAPHVPLQAKTTDLQFYRNEGSVRDSLKQVYAAMVTCLDSGIGRILDVLEQLNIQENTLVLFLSDNGADEGSGGGSSGELKGHKFLEYDGGVRTLAMIRWTARLKSKTTISQLTGYVDVFPTICEIVSPDSKTPPFDGMSILKVLEGERNNIGRALYLGCGTLIENEWKIIKAGKNPRMKLSHDVLYNIITDPAEENDLSQQYPDVMRRLSEEAAKYDSIKPVSKLPPYESGRQGFVPPHEWNIFLKNEQEK